MSSLICPVSNEKVDEKAVRGTALLSFIIAVLFTVKPNLYAAGFLAIDFYSRGFGMKNTSILACSGAGLTQFVPFQSKEINKGPKIFAARVGFLFSIVSFILLLSQFVLASQIVMGVLTLFAFLEWSVGFCMGCYVYTYAVLPFYKRNRKKI
jgi:hypothetical protein